MNEDVDYNAIFIKEEVDHDIINAEGSHQIFIKEPDESNVLKSVADPVDIEINKEYCPYDSLIEPAVPEVFDEKQEFDDFKVDKYENFDVSNDIRIKEEKSNFSKHETSDSILYRYLTYGASKAQEASMADGSSVEKEYNATHQKDLNISEGNNNEELEAENQDVDKYQIKFGNLENYENVLTQPSVGMHKGNKFKCCYCDYSVPCKSTLIIHMRTHTGEKPYKCSDCDYRASRLSHLKDHKRTHTGEKPYKCNQCDYSASNKHHLRDHIRTHTGEKPYKCSNCDYSTSRKNTLNIHMRTHTGEKPYRCVHCDYSASDKRVLNHHMRIHTGEKPYKCNDCDYSASLRSTLTSHMRTHTGEKPYKCNDCDYKASRLSYLKEHIRTHTGEKPFKCSICDYSASLKGTLTNHMRTHTGKMPQM